jgi:argininosuccinate lyase
VQHCVGKKLDLRGLSRADLRAFHPAFPAGARELVDLESALEGRALPGGTARARVEEALARAEAEARAELAALGSAAAS